jgi:hypothetical protein
MINYTIVAMLEFILKLLTPKDHNGNIETIIGYFIQNDIKKLAIVKSNAIKTEVYGLEVVIGETHRQKDTNQGGQNLSEYKTKIYLTQHDNSNSTIERVIDLIYETDSLYDQEVYWPETGALRRAVVTVFHRCLCPNFE